MEYSKDFINTLPRMYYLSEANPNNNTIGIQRMMEEISHPDWSMVEVGSFSGVSSMMFASFCRLVWCVDIWDLPTDYKELTTGQLKLAESYFDQNAKLFPNIRKVKDYSESACIQFNNHSLDFVYLDGSHDYDSVKRDILCWLPKIKDFGWIGGHDIDLDGERVQKAVYEVFGTEIKTYCDSSWCIQIK